MSSSLKLLKQAKKLLSDDPEESIDLLHRVLKNEPDSTNAYLLLGKAYIITEDVDKAENALHSCIECDPDNHNAWKGYFSIVKNQGDYKKFFDAAGNYARVLADDREGVYSIAKDVKLYVKKNSQNDPAFMQYYYRALLPGTYLAEICGNQILNAESAIENLLKIELELESKDIRAQSDKMRLKFNKATASVKVQEYKWVVYEKSKIEELYQLLINVTHDDEKRRNLEEDLLRYKFLKLQTIPESEQPEAKNDYKKQVLEMVNGMVLVKHPSLFAWNLFFDLNDFENISDVETEYLINFLKLFRGKGLANIIYAYVLSGISLFDKSVFLKIKEEAEKEEEASKKRIAREKRELQEAKQNGNEKPSELDEKSESPTPVHRELEKASLVDNETMFDNSLSAEEILTLMENGYKEAKDCLLANKILTLYYLYLQEYESSLNLCKTGIDLLINTRKSTGFELLRARQFFTVKLALVYTYYEPPKNFATAIRLYDATLKNYPKNVDAKVGKGLVYMQEGNLAEAKSLLFDVVEENPDNNNALLELSWCQIQLRELKTGREGLEKGFELIKGTDLRSYELKAMILWRLAQSYLYEIDILDKQTGGKATDLVQTAFDLLLRSLKANRNYAPTYTSLGVIYSTYFDDENKALKCFIKAFENDVGEIVAARYLVENFAKKAEWELAEVLCERMVTSERVRRKLQTLDFDKSWPYRVLGTSALESQRGDKAVEWFQSAIRLLPTDVESWVGLGEAYLLFGRLESAIKVFNKAINIDNSHWHAKYLLGVTQYQIKEFEASILTLESILEQRPDEECVIMSLYIALISSSSNYIIGGFYGRAIESAIKAVDLLEAAAVINSNSQKLWKAVADVAKIFLRIQSSIDKFPFEKFIGIIQTKIESYNIFSDDMLDRVNSVDRITPTSLQELYETGHYKDFIAHLAIIAGKFGIACSGKKLAKVVRAGNWYNLGLAQLEAYFHLEKPQFRDAAIESLKHSIKLESSDANFWLTLGVATISVNPRISQHCFIKASALDPRNADVWSNLAVLYLRYGDVELSQQTFLKAQSIAPDHPGSWIGDALLAEASGDTETAAKLFGHAFVLSNGRSPLAQLMYGLSVCGRRIARGDDKRDIQVAQELTMADFALTRYLKQVPNDDVAIEISCDILERIGDHEHGEKLATQLCEIFEAKYEETESEAILLKYAQVKTQLARFNLGNENYEAAIENAQFTLDILDASDEGAQELGNEQDKPGSRADQVKKCVLSSKTVLGLSYYFLDNLEQSIEEFKRILKISGEANSFVILVTQSLYNYDTPETKQAALDELFEFIANHGTTLITLFTLTAMLIIEGDEESLLAAKEELEGLSLAQLSADAYRKVPTFISHITKRLGRDSVVNHWQRNAMFFPNDYNVWKHLDAKIAANIGSTGQATIDSKELSTLYTKTRQFRLIQRSMVFNPENTEAYKALVGVVAQT